jgi:hypothetical protein
LHGLCIKRRQCRGHIGLRQIGVNRFTRRLHAGGIGGGQCGAVQRGLQLGAE